MHASLVMTMIGPDRPGLVDAVARLVAEQGGNWLESRMSRLGGQFAGILRVEVPFENESHLTTALAGLESLGLTVVIHRDLTETRFRGTRLNILEIVGQDRPGIVRELSHAIAEHGVNVEELETECASAAMSGETLFKARAKLSIPEACDVGELRRKLEKIAGDLIVDISLADVKQA